MWCGAGLEWATGPVWAGGPVKGGAAGMKHRSQFYTYMFFFVVFVFCFVFLGGRGFDMYGYDWCFRLRFCSLRLNCAGDNLGY